MFKILTSLFLLFFCITSPTLVKAENFVSVVNPIRGSEFWETKNQSVEDVVRGEAEILRKYNLPATWLLRFDALENKDILKIIEGNSEKGLFLEITPSWTDAGGVDYRQSSSWHDAGSAFLTGYEIKDREKLIDTAFDKFKSTFGSFPKTVGAWWIDSYSLNYMQEKYDVISALIVADQYTTDNYQIWGQYFSTPFYPDKKNALHPAQTLQNKLPVVVSQWAPRDPVNAYGNGVYESTFSVQPNDYIDFHNLDISYFKKIVDLYTTQKFNQFGSLVVGLENTYDWSKYKDEYEKQMEYLVGNKNIKVVTLGDFSSWYKLTFPNLSPAHVVVADDPLESDKKVVWFMNPYYRAGWFYNNDGSVFRDIRQYIEGEEELCFKKRCDSVNFATSATRVLDEVSFGHKWILDSGKISDFKVEKVGEKFVINYKNEAGNSRKIEFLPRDISIDGTVTSIDVTILNAIKNDSVSSKRENNFDKGGFEWNVLSSITKILKFLAFFLVACLIPGFVLTSKLNIESFFKKVFLAVSIGFVLQTLTFYGLSLLNLRWAFLIFIFINLVLFLKLKLYKLKLNLNFSKLGLISSFVIIIGTIFQNIPSFKNGLVFPYGMGFWGPNTHDGVWHISLINQLINNVPPQNPIFSGTVLKNYHFFYDLLIASTAFFTNIPVIDLVFRFYPIIFSLMLGIGTFYLSVSLFEKYSLVSARLGAVFSLYFVYFAGSFGWIVEYIRQKTLGGESAFWANQSISFNLNPPFAISLIIVISILLLLPMIKSKVSVIIQILLVGTLVAFKAYAAALIIVSYLVMAVLTKNLRFLLIFAASSLISGVLLLLNSSTSKTLFAFSPFWFIHSMIDAPDRVGWTRLTLTRTVGLETKNWFKFISAEAIGLFLFIVGNLGMRILSLFILLKISKIFKDVQSLFILVFTVFSFAIPILFIQSGNPWNTIQFSYYGLYITSVISGIVVARFYHKLPKLLAFLIIGSILILTPVNSITTATYYLGYYPHGRIDLKELEGLEFLSNQQDKGVVLTYPYDEKLKRSLAEPWPLFVYDSTAYVSALTKKEVFLEDIAQNQILLTDYSKRQVLAKDFFASPNRGYNFLKDNNIKYIYIPKLHKVSLERLENSEIIFENSEVIIYKIN